MEPAIATLSTAASAPAPVTVTVDDTDLLHAVMDFLNDNDAVALDADDETTNDSYSSAHSDASGSPTHKPTTGALTFASISSTNSPAAPSSSSSSTSPMDVDKAHSGVLPRLQPRRPKINRSRERMRKETVALREQVLELQDRLEVLQGGVSSRLGIPPAEQTVREREDREARRLRALAWQAIAEHESVKKQAAEDEREHLRALLKEQKLAFRRLRRYLGKYGDKSQWAPLKNELYTDDDLLEHETATHAEQLARAQTARHEFDEISRMLPAMYLQTNAVFADARLDGLTSSLRDVKFQNPLTPSMSVEALDSRLVPFDVVQTASAVWEYQRTKVRKLTAAGDTRLEETDDSIRRVFQSSINHMTFSGSARVRMETRRYVESERVVLVQSAVYDSMRVGNTLLPNYGLRQFQWTVIGPPRNFLLRHSGKTMSQVEIFEVTVPVLDHVSGMDRLDLLKRMKSLCAASAELHRELERESVESILMESLLQHSNLDSSMLQPPGNV